MYITALEPQNPRANNYNLYVDTHLFGVVSSNLVLELDLRVGRELSAAELEQLRIRNSEEQLLNRALNFLAPRPRSRAEVRRRLLAPPRAKSRGVADPTAVDRILDRLEDLHLLDDRQFADFWVENRERFSPRSARALTQELRQRGVDKDTTREASRPEEDEERALAAGRQRLRAISTLSYPDFRTRLGQFLQRRGFDYDVVRRVTRQLWDETGGMNASSSAEATDEDFAAD